MTTSYPLQTEEMYLTWLLWWLSNQIYRACSSLVKDDHWCCPPEVLDAFADYNFLHEGEGVVDPNVW